MSVIDHTTEPDGLYILLLSVHGLIRGTELELGRDADTGGQTKYVVELTRALSKHPRVQRVDLLTRAVVGKGIDTSYSEPVEPLGNNARIVRLPFGPRRYLYKERLWPHLDSLSDQIIFYIRQVGRMPDVIHAHYADAGYVGSSLARLLGVPLVFTGHSLGREKKRRMLDNGSDEDALESRFRFQQRIEAEETALDTAELVVTSTAQEIDSQYERYDHYDPSRMRVIPPGIDLSRFSPMLEDDSEPPIAEQVLRFLKDPEKPMVLAIARPDARKNLNALVEAFGTNEELRRIANLVLVAGNRDVILQMNRSVRKVLLSLLLDMDSHDLYGSMAFPKQHAADDIPDLYRLAAQTKGVFVNCALTEPFGLTLIEAAASGLPIIGPNDGGPRDIIDACKNGRLIDPLDIPALGAAILEMLQDKEQWSRWAKDGLEGVHEHYSWRSHVNRYVAEVSDVLKRRDEEPVSRERRGKFTKVNRILVTSLDDTLTGDPEALDAFRQKLREMPDYIALAVVTGRKVDDAQELFCQLDLPNPDIWITSAGTRIFYGGPLVQDKSWEAHLNYYWEPTRIRRVLSELEGIELQDPEQQGRFKVSYFVSGEDAPDPQEVKRRLRKRKLRTQVVHSYEAYYDILPIRASVGLAVRYLAFKLDIPPERILAAGYSGSDEDLLSGNTLGVVVGNSSDLEHLRGKSRIYFSKGSYAWGLLEGLDHYNFLGDIRVPEEEQEEA